MSSRVRPEPSRRATSPTSRSTRKSKPCCKRTAFCGGAIAGVSVLTSSRAGFELINLLTGFTHALIIDCLELPEPIPGRVQHLNLSRLSGSARLVGVHDLSVADAFELATVLGTEMPGIVEIYAVEGGDMLTLCEEMTPAVAAAVAPLARSVLARASEWVRSAHPAAG